MARKIYFNVQTGEVVASDESPSIISASPVVLFVGDTIDLQFLPQEPSGDPAAPWTPFTIPGGATFKLGVKKATAFGAGSYYAYQDTFTNITNGKACTLSLNTAALLADLTTGTASADYVFELEMVSGGNASTLVQWTQTIHNQVNIGSEGAVTPGSPTYPTFTEMQAFVQGGNSNLQFFKRVALASGSRTFSITFDVTLSSATFNVEWSYENVTDVDPDFLGPPVFTAKSTTNLSGKLNAEPTTANTVLVLKGNLDPS